MDKLWEIIKIFIIANAILIGIFMFLVSIPQSRLRYFLLRFFGMLFYCVTGLAALYIISPADLIPDIIPFLGQLDDAAAGVIIAIFTGLMGWLSNRASGELPGKTDEANIERFCIDLNKKRRPLDE